MSERSVRTDALETLGMIHEREEKRDAIHLAVIPAVAGERLLPGTHVGVSSDGKAYVTAPDYCVGIVDPFLLDAVVHRERFWLVIYPRKITSLRHVWSHPAFPDEPSVGAPAPPTEPRGSAVEVARARIRDMAADLDCSVDRLMEGAAEYMQAASTCTLATTSTTTGPQRSSGVATSSSRARRRPQTSPSSSGAHVEGAMTWRDRPICLDCQRIIHGPGTGPVGPRGGTAIVDAHWWPRTSQNTPKCVLCKALASPAAMMRLWADEPPDTPPPQAA